METAIQQIQSGGTDCERAARTLFTLLWRRFVVDFQRAGLSLAAAEDLASDAFCRVYQGLPGLRELHAAEKWVRQIARHSLQNHWRNTAAARQHEVQVEDDETLSMLSDMAAAEVGGAGNGMPGGDPAVWNCLQRQLGSYCEKHPERAMWLEHLVLEGWSISELSEATGKTLGATREYLYQCRLALKEYLAQCMDVRGAA